MKPPSDRYRSVVNAKGYVRWPFGLALIVGGGFGFLPVLGFWMIPLGLVLCFAHLPSVRRWANRWRRSLRDSIQKVARSKQKRAAGGGP